LQHYSIWLGTALAFHSVKPPCNLRQANICQCDKSSHQQIVEATAPGSSRVQITGLGNFNGRLCTLDLDVDFYSSG